MYKFGGCCALNKLGSRPWPFGVTLRRLLCHVTIRFLPHKPFHFPICFFGQFFGKTYRLRLTTIHTLQATDIRRTQHCSISATVSTLRSANRVLIEYSSNGGTTGSASDQQSTNDRKVAGSRPTKVVCITVLTGNRMGVNCPLWPAATPSEL